MSKFKVGERVLLLGDLQECKNWSTLRGVRVGTVLGYTDCSAGHVVKLDSTPAYLEWDYPLSAVRKLTDFHMAMLGISDE